MSALYLSAPNSRVKQGTHQKEFGAILRDHTCPDYAIYSTLYHQVYIGMRVVLFDRKRRLKAEGTVSEIKPKRFNKVPRYDLVVPNLALVAYTEPPRVNRCGVALI